MSSYSKVLQRFGIISIAIVYLFQIFTLNYPGLNADEALFTLILEEWQNLFTHHEFKLNPILDYAGPMDLWLFGSLYGLMSLFPEITPGPWMVRIIPLLLYLPAFILLFKELRKWSKDLASWFLMTQSILPLVLIYTRIAWAHCAIYSAFLYLIAEAIRFLRTDDFRWIRCTIVAGLAIEGHSIAFLGIFAVFAPVFKNLIQKALKEKLYTTTAILIGIFLSYPVLRNFPPPSGDGHGSNKVLFQLRSLFNAVTGVQPFEFFLVKDPAPQTLLVIFGIFVFFTIGYQFKSVQNSKSPLDRFLKFFWITHLVGIIYVLLMGITGRNLMTPGTERYYLSLLPGWTLILADGFRRIFDGTRKMNIIGVVTYSILFIFSFGRFAAVILSRMNETDPNLIAAQWLMKECPKNQCVVIAENHWNYWPIRYYSRNELNINILDPSWKATPRFSTDHKRLAGCWFDVSSNDRYKGPYQSKLTIPGQKNIHGQICKSEIQK